MKIILLGIFLLPINLSAYDDHNVSGAVEAEGFYIGDDKSEAMTPYASTVMATNTLTGFEIGDNVATNLTKLNWFCIRE